MRDLFDKHGGFRRLHTFTLATIIQLETGRFCRRFLTHDHREAGLKLYDPKGRPYDQMVQGARSGRQNIIEGSERASTSKDTEMKLTDVARASLSRTDSVGSVVLARSASATPSSFARYGPRIGPRLAHSSACGSICFAITSLPTESVRLRMERDLEGFEDPELDLASEVGETKQRLGLGDVEVVAGEQAEGAAAVQEVAQVLDHEVEAAGANEGDAQVGGGRAVEVRAEVGQQGVVRAAVDERLVMGRLGHRKPRRRRSPEVVSLRRDDVAHAAAWVGQVP
ncbi:MAG: hypothetical protein KGS10_18940 [Chloroflexi bacterium]|nr:hypothetical protein [Chloroflexota bacterium]